MAEARRASVKVRCGRDTREELRALKARKSESYDQVLQRLLADD